jgi:hypothetical protein
MIMPDLLLGVPQLSLQPITVYKDNSGIIMRETVKLINVFITMTVESFLLPEVALRLHSHPQRLN